MIGTSIVKTNVRCRRCGLRLIFENYMQHQRYHSKPDLVRCQFCYLGFHSTCELGFHIFHHHAEGRHAFQMEHGDVGEDPVEVGEVIPNVCKNCGECFECEEDLTEHQKKCEKTEDAPSPPERNACKTEKPEETDAEAPNLVIDEGEKWHTCVSCREAFSSRARLVEHVKEEHAKGEVAMIPCSLCSVVFMKTAMLFGHLDAHLAEGGENLKVKFYECGTCRQKFHEEEALNVHRRLHRPRKLVCPICRRRFKDELSLRQHVRAHQEIDFCCSRCDKSFASFTKMLYHQKFHRQAGQERTSPKDMFEELSEEEEIEIQGRKQKPFGCGICKECFTSPYELHTHIFMHLNKKPLQCNQCHKNLYSQKSLRVHKKRHCQKDVDCAPAGKRMCTNAHNGQIKSTHSQGKKKSMTNLKTD